MAAALHFTGPRDKCCYRIIYILYNIDDHMYVVVETFNNATLTDDHGISVTDESRHASMIDNKCLLLAFN